MKAKTQLSSGRVTVDAARWQEMQERIVQAIGLCMDIVGHIEAHKRNGAYSAAKLLDMIEGEAREARKALEALDLPF
jgi:glycerate-2-kinase